MTACTYFPQYAPFDEGLFDAGQGHSIWYVQYGSPKGIPLMWLHGGPGSGLSSRHQCFIDPARYRLIMFDQRGCGNSTPLGEIRENNTGRLIDDIEHLRIHLGITGFLLGGGSWGAGLALAYAENHGHALLGLVLRAPFLAGRQDIDRFFQPSPASAGIVWETFASHAPKAYRDNLLQYYAAEIQVTGGRRALALAQAWALYEQQREQPQPRNHRADLNTAPDSAMVEPVLPDSAAQRLLARYRIQSHYLINDCFVREDNLLAAASRLNNLPVAILHGANDTVCDTANARRLHDCMAGSRLVIVKGAGHDPYHPEMACALIDALRSFADHRSFEGWGENHVNA
jgi:proline iminopeptidase